MTGLKAHTFVISRTDSIGDVVLTLPVAGYLKKLFPACRVILLGNDYTKPVIAACAHIDDFADWSHIRAMSYKEQLNSFRSFGADVILHVYPRPEIALLAKQAGIRYRIGATGRFYNWLHCNRLVPMSRRRSPLHESQLNLRLLSPLGVPSQLELDQIAALYVLTQTEALSREFDMLPDKNRFNLILHPKSKGSAREWGSDNFAALANMLPADKFKVFVTGTEAEGSLLASESFFEKAENIVNLTGRLSLSQLIAFIGKADGLLAASTGPLHLAAAMGKTALGIYPPIQPMHPGRWAPVGLKASYLVTDKACNDCRKAGSCHCMQEIKPGEVYARLQAMITGTDKQNQHNGNP